MSRVTRSSARRPISPSPTSGSGTTNVTPIFSAQASVINSDTPPTSASEEETKKPKRNARKRAASNELDFSDPDEVLSKQPAAKRRAVSKTVFVEVPYKPQGKATTTRVRIVFISKHNFKGTDFTGHLPRQ